MEVRLKYLTKNIWKSLIVLSFSWTSQAKISKDSGVVFSCQDIKHLHVPTLYEWMKNILSKSKTDKLIAILEHIPYAVKQKRLLEFCQNREIKSIFSHQNELLNDVLAHLLFSDHDMGLKNEDTPNQKLCYPTNSEQSCYDPTKNNPELSFAWQEKLENRKVYLSKSRKAPQHWQETCLGIADNGQDIDFGDCYQSESRQLSLMFDPTKTHFQIKSQKLCLGQTVKIPHPFIWQTCDASDAKQYFERIKHQAGENSYALFKIRHSSSNTILFDHEYVYFRDAFPLIPISKPLDAIPKKSDFDAFFAKAHFSAKNDYDIIVVWIDTIRKDTAFTSVMPNLSSHAKKHITFEKSFAGATATRASGFTLWNSRPATEWKHFTTNRYGEHGSINLRVLKNLGYDIHAIASIPPVIDENLFNDRGLFKKDEHEVKNNPKLREFQNRYLFYRKIFDFEKPIDQRKIEKVYSLTDAEYSSLTTIQQDKKVVDIFRKEWKKPKIKPRAFLLWLVGPHTPYHSDEETQHSGMKQYPSFNPYFQDHFGQVQMPLWDLWFYDHLGLGSGINNQEALMHSYSNHATSSDMRLASIFQELNKTSAWDHTIVVVLSDHGESLFENSYVGHGGPPLQKVLEVPIVYSFPKLESLRSQVKKTTGAQMDVFPTVFDALDINSKDLDFILKSVKGSSIFQDSDDCYISGEPNGYGYQTVEFAIFNGQEKLRARFRLKEKNPDTYLASENPLSSNAIEPIAYTDYSDIPLNPGVSMKSIEKNILDKFGRCFKKYFEL